MRQFDFIHQMLKHFEHQYFEREQCFVIILSNYNFKMLFAYVKLHLKKKSL